MKKILIINLIFIFLLSLVLVSPVMAKSSVPVGASVFPVSKNDNIISETLTDIKVINLKNESSVSVVESPVASSCKISTLPNSQNNLVQEAGVINLNQTKDCFNLNFSVVPKTVNLSVQTLQVTQKIVVVSQAQKLETSSLLPYPTEPGSLPILPTTYVGLIFAFVVSKNYLVRKLEKNKNSLLIIFNFLKPQILRC